MRYVIFRIKGDFDLHTTEEHSLAERRAVKVIAFPKIAAQSGCVYFRSFNLPKQQSLNLVLLAAENPAVPRGCNQQ